MLSLKSFIKVTFQFMFQHVIIACNNLIRRGGMCKHAIEVPNYMIEAGR